MTRPIRVAVAAAVVVLASAASAGVAAAEELFLSELAPEGGERLSFVAAGPGIDEVARDPGAFSVQVGDRNAAVRRTEPLGAEGLDVLLAIDTSGSMDGEPMNAAKAAAAQFVGQLPHDARVAIVGFGPAPRPAADFGVDRAAQLTAIAGLHAGGETALYDAVAASAQQLGAVSGRRRAIVVLSDGGDTVSRASLAQAASALRSTGADAFAVALVTPESDTAALAVLMGDDAARVVPVTEAAALDHAFRTIAANLTARVRLTVATEGTGTVPVTVRVETPAGVLQARAEVTLPAVAVAPRAATRPTAGRSVDGPGLLGSSVALTVGVGAAFLGLLAAALVLLIPGRAHVRLGSARQATPASQLSSIVRRASATAERALDGGERRHRIDRAVEAAGLTMRAGEVVVLAVSATVTLLVLGALVAGPLVGMAFAALSAPLAPVVLGLLGRRRRGAFTEQMEDLLHLLTGSLRTGYGLLQALDAAATELEAPAADELRRVTTEVRLGRDLADSLDAAAARVANEDFEWVSQAIRIHREVGGDLAEVLDRVSETIRARGRLRRQVASLSAEGRLSAVVLMALPFGMAGLFLLTNRPYLAELFSNAAGWAMVTVGLVLMTAGGLWLRRIVRPVY